MTEPQITNIAIGAEAAPPAAVTEPLDPKRTVTFTDGEGRSISFRKLPLSRRLALIGMLGADANNGTVEVYALNAACVVEIDGQKVVSPASRLELNALIDRLEDTTILDVARRYAIEFPTRLPDPATLKNASGTPSSA
jgi:hypothetical protein